MKYSVLPSFSPLSSFSPLPSSLPSLLPFPSPPSFPPLPSPLPSLLPSPPLSSPPSSPALSKMEELLMEMKTDVSRLPSELAKMPSVSTQLKMDEISTISKLAKGVAPVSHSVITQGPAAATAGSPSSPSSAQQTHRSKSPKPKKDVVVVVPDKSKLQQPSSVQQQTIAPKYKVAYTSSPAGQAAGPQVQLPPGSGLAVQTAEGLVVYSVASSSTNSSPAVVQQAGTTATTSGQTYIGVPTYIDSSSLYQTTVQLVPAVTGQQVMYWPSVVGGSGQGTAQVTTVAAAGTGVGSQLAVVQRGSAGTVLQPVQFNVDNTKGTTSTNSVITID